MYSFVYKKLDNNNNVSNRQKTLPNYFISMNKENQKKTINAIVKHLFI